MIMDIFTAIGIGFVRMAVILTPEFHIPDLYISAWNYFMFYVTAFTVAFPFLFSVWVVLIVMITYKITVRIANFMFGVVSLIRGSGKPTI